MPLPDLAVVSKPVPARKSVRESRKYWDQTNPKYTRLMSRLLNFEPPLPIKLPKTARPPPCFLTRSLRVSSYSSAIVKKRTNSDLETTHDITVSERPAFEIGEAGGSRSEWCDKI